MTSLSRQMYPRD